MQSDRRPARVSPDGPAHNRDVGDGKREVRRAASASADRSGFDDVGDRCQVALDACVEVGAAVVVVGDAAPVLSQQVEVGISVVRDQVDSDPVTLGDPEAVAVRIAVDAERESQSSVVQRPLAFSPPSSSVLSVPRSMASQAVAVCAATGRGPSSASVPAISTMTAQAVASRRMPSRAWVPVWLVSLICVSRSSPAAHGGIGSMHRSVVAGTLGVPEYSGNRIRSPRRTRG